MDICHVYQYERTARNAHYDFIGSLYSDKKRVKVIENKRDRCIVDGDIHWFMGEEKYVNWCKGRTYLLDGQKMHSGYPIK